MADIHERVGKLEQKTHTLEYQVGELKEWPPRVVDMERTVQSLSTSMIHVQQVQNETRREMKEGFQSVNAEIDQGFRELRAALNSNAGEKTGFSRALKWITALVALAGIGTTGALWYAENVNASPDVAGMAAQCKDGSYSTSEGRGTCSHNGGVKRWIQ